ncbi:uncharacterized protein LOC119646392 [Hermetia illucens]|nr:uncharacterized protein LOC119646392 [Hermetia illucens]
MSQPTPPFGGAIGHNSPNQFKVPPPNVQNVPPPQNNGNMFNSQMNTGYYPYGNYNSPEQWVVPNPAYFYNSWPYPQTSSTPPAMMMQSPPPPPPSGGQLPANFNPGQPPPPLPKPVVKMPPPPPPDNAARRGRCVYPRGGRNGFKGPTRQNSGNNANPAQDTAARPQNMNGEGETSSNAVNSDPHQVQVHKKPKRKPMSSRYTRKRAWCREDADKVLALENQCTATAPTLVIRFPDPELNSYMVKGFSPEIESVHFQIPYKARSCFVKLRPGADISKVCEEICKIPFGTGFLKAEEKHIKQQNKSTSPDGIDPYTLYVGNLPPHITVAEIKENFPTATYIDVGFAQKMKYTRYAFIQYATVEEAMEAYKKTINLMLDKRNLVVRFRRTKGNIGLPGDSKTPNPKKAKNNDSDCEIVKDDGVLQKKSRTDDDATVDSKENVSREAARLMRRLLDKDDDSSEFGEDRELPTPPLGNGPIVNIKTEKDDDMDEYMDEADLLGTQIKDEPIDVFCDDFYPESNDEEDDEIPPELMYDRMNSIDDFSYLQDDHDEADEDDRDSFGPRNWDRNREKELEEKEEKPDIRTLQRTDSSEMKAPKLRLRDIASEKKDELDDLFNAMNPESDDDDF